MNETFELVVKTIDETQTILRVKGNQFSSGNGVVTLSFDGLKKMSIPLVMSSIYKLRLKEVSSGEELFSTIGIYKGYDYAIASAPLRAPDGKELVDKDGNVKMETATLANHINFLEV